MKKIEDLINNLSKLPELQNNVITEVLQSDSEGLVSQVKGQLMDGVDGEGKGLRPTYLEDPFFKTRQQAIGYMNWKQKITPSSTRNPENPNLYINGYFHSLLFLRLESDRAYISANDAFGNEIVSKYGQKAFGVSDVYISEQIIPMLRNEVIKQFKIQLGI